MSKKTRFRELDQRGQTLLAALVLSFVLAIFGYTLMKLVTYQMQVTVETKRKDRIASAADAAMQRTIAMLASTQTAGVMQSISLAAGYNSLTLTGTAFTDVPGVKYWIKVLNGDKADTLNAYGATSDTAVTMWSETGDPNYDRTIFIRVVDTKSGKEDSFYNTVHRNNVLYTPGGVGIAAIGCVDLGNSWSADTYNSCYGAYDHTTLITVTDAEGVSKTGYNASFYSPSVIPTPGSVQSSCISGTTTDIKLTLNMTAFAQPPAPSYYYALESNYFPVTSVTLVTALPDLTGNSTVGAIGLSSTAWPAAPWKNFWGGGAYRIDTINTSGNTTINMDVSRGYIHIYCYETVGLSGNVNLFVISPTAQMLVDDFSNTYLANVSMQNLSGYASVQGVTYSSATYVSAVAVNSATSGQRLSITASSSAFYWSTGLTVTTMSLGAVCNELGYREFSFDVSPTSASDTFDAGIVYWNYATNSELTVTTQVAFTDTTPFTKYITFSSVAPVGLTVAAETVMRRIIFTNFNLNASPKLLIIDNLKVRRYGGPYCCSTADAVLYGMSSDEVDLSGTGDYQCLLYFSNSLVKMVGSGHGYFEGAIVAQTFQQNGGGAGWFHYDQCLSQNVNDTYAAPPIISNKWRQIGRKY